jgi:hypothetical protein
MLMDRYIAVAACFLVALLSSTVFLPVAPASAMTFRIDFVDLLGTYDVVGESRSTSVDSGVATPFRVDHVAIELDAVSACDGDPACDPDSGYRALTGFISGGEFHFTAASSVRRERSIPNPMAFDESGFWMSVRLGNSCVDGSTVCPSAPITLTHAALVVTGETVPETSSGSMLLLGLATLAARRAQRAA